VNAAERPSRLRLTVYSRNYCHLCDDMHAALKQLAPVLGFEIDVVDVDSSPELEQRYGELVPVLVHGEAQICNYFLDSDALTAYVAAFR
jgi:hypothetical protein